jgi:hypothetical protein
MRRLVTVFCLALLGVGLSPVPADAYFWEWIDSLSGPRFGGLVFELELKCGKTSLASDVPAIVRLQAEVRAEAATYRDTAFTNTTALAYRTRAVGYAERASTVLGTLYEEARKYQSGDGRRDEDEALKPLTALALEALAWQQRAAQSFEWAAAVQAGRNLDPRRQPGDYDNVERSLAVPVSGVKLSLCGYQPLERNSHFLSAAVAAGLDIKNDDGGARGRHLMVTAGLSYHKVLRPWITVGAGGGLAYFNPSGATTFTKAYVQPWIVDIKPAAFGRNADRANAWRHFVFVRYSGLTFPGGFERGQFNEGSEEYPTELVHALGIHFDLTPVLRQRQGNW